MQSGGPGHQVDFYMEVGIQTKNLALKDNHGWGGGRIQLRSLIGAGPEHPQVLYPTVLG